MKKMMMALAAVVVASVAGAVTATWNTTESTFTTADGAVAGLAGDSFTLTAKLTIASDFNTANASLLSLTSDKKTWLNWGANGYNNSGSHTTALTVANGTTQYSQGDFSVKRMSNTDDTQADATGENTMTFYFTKKGDTNTYDVTYTVVWANGQKSDNYASGATRDFGSVTIDAADGIIFDGLSVSTGVTLNSVTIEGAGVAVLPEPTVMALLALGVAGVALRRKHA